MTASHNKVVCAKKYSRPHNVGTWVQLLLPTFSASQLFRLFIFCGRLRAAPSCARRALNGLRQHGMGPAHTSDLAWRVVLRFHWYDQSDADICCPRTGLAVSRHFVADVLARFEASGDVATRPGQGASHSSRRVLTADDDLAIIKLLIETPQATLRDHRAEFILESGKVVSYSSFCGAVHRLGFTRKKVRSPAWSAAFLLLATFLSLATFRVQTFVISTRARSCLCSYLLLVLLVPLVPIN